MIRHELFRPQSPPNFIQLGPLTADLIDSPNSANGRVPKRWINRPGAKDAKRRKANDEQSSRRFGKAFSACAGSFFPSGRRPSQPQTFVVRLLRLLRKEGSLTQSPKNERLANPESRNKHERTLSCFAGRRRGTAAANRPSLAGGKEAVIRTFPLTGSEALSSRADLSPADEPGRTESCFTICPTPPADHPR